MEWVLVLIISVSQGQYVTATIAGHRSKQACLATLENARKEAEDTFGMSPMLARETFKRSMCVERAAK